jgi:hypothetical protein
MRWLALATVAMLAACSSEERVALELTVPQGMSLANAAQIDILLAGPATYPRAQRVNKPMSPLPANAPWPAATRGKVHYLAQRAPIVTVKLEAGQAVDHLRIQLAIDAAAQYEPIVAVRDGNGELLALGTYDATELFKLVDEGDVAPYVSTESGKLKIYPVPLEAAKQVSYVAGDQPTALVPGTATVVACGDQPSGLVWMRSATDELRLLFPIDGSDDADPRLANIDLDCDHEIAGYGDGTRNDCDDTLGTTNGKAKELCNGVDDNCDDTPGFAFLDTCTDGCNGPGGACSDLVPATTPNRCVQGQCGTCQIEGKITGSAGVPTKQACEAQAHLAPGPCSSQACTVTLVYVDPRWEVRIGSGASADNGLDQPVMLDGTLGEKLVIAAKSGKDFPAAEVSSGAFVLLVSGGGVTEPYAMTLDVVSSGVTSCPSPSTMTCGT